MEDLIIIRKRYIPEEEVDISSDRVLVHTDNILITKWIPIKPRGDFAWGISYVDLTDHYKISRFYDDKDTFLFWYCDILEVTQTWQEGKQKYILTDLLIDVILYPDGTCEIKDMDELEEALQTGLIDERQYYLSIQAKDRLLEKIQTGHFPPEDFPYWEFEKGHVDLHMHSTCSDGTFSPAELVQMAKKAGLSAIALTDHDTIDGIAEAQEEAKRVGIEFIPGVEFSADPVHILGYFPWGGIEGLTEVLELFLKNRRLRARKMAQRLTDLGLPLTYEEIVEEAKGDRFLGRVHFAGKMVAKGFVPSVKEAFYRWIGDGKPGYVEKEGYTACEVISKIHACGGVPVLAHPRQIKRGTAGRIQLIAELSACGLKGIETYYADNTNAETKESIGYAKANHLIMTGGSDFHGTNRPEVQIGKGRGNLVVPYECVTDLKKIQRTRNA